MCGHVGLPYQASPMMLHQAFMEAFGVAMGSCFPKSWGALLYPLQLLTGNVLLAALLRMLATTHLWVIVDEEPAPKAPIPRVLETPAPLTGTKQQCHSSDQDVLALRQEKRGNSETGLHSEEHPGQKRKEGRPVAKAFKEPCHEAFSRSWQL